MSAQTALILIVVVLVVAVALLVWSIASIDAQVPPAPDATKKPVADDSSLL